MFHLKTPSHASKTCHLRKEIFPQNCYKSGLSKQLRPEIVCCCCHYTPILYIFAHNRHKQKDHFLPFYQSELQHDRNLLQ